MKTLNKIIIVIANFCLLIVALWAVTVPITGNKKYYMYEFEKNKTVEETGYNLEELSLIADSIINYLMEKSDDMQIIINEKPVFSNQAIIHMKDVKSLYIGGKIIGIICLTLLILSIAYIIVFYKDLKSYLLKYSLITISVIGGLLLLFALYALIDFDNAFVFFHKVLFPNEQKFNDAFFSSHSNYPELPGTDNLMLIKILDISLFMDCGIIIGSFVLITEAIWFIILNIFNKKVQIKKAE